MSELEKHTVRGKIMVVDKEIMIRNMLRMALNDLAKVIDVSSAEMGLEMLSTDGPCDIVITSNSLFAMSGLDFLRKVAEQYPETVRILMTAGCLDVINVNLAMIEGVVSRVVLKPIRLAEFRADLKNYINTVPSR